MNEESVAFLTFTKAIFIERLFKQKTYFFALKFRIIDTAKPKSKPQNAEPIPKNWIPEALNKKVSKAASLSFTS